MRDIKKEKIVLASLKKVQNVVYFSSIAQIALGFMNCWVYKMSDYKGFWLFLIALNIFLAGRGILMYQRGHKIVWELENEISSN